MDFAGSQIGLPGYISFLSVFPWNPSIPWITQNFVLLFTVVVFARSNVRHRTLGPSASRVIPHVWTDRISHWSVRVEKVSVQLKDTCMNLIGGVSCLVSCM